MGAAFESAQGELAEKLFAALKAGDDAGGDSRGKQSASMIVVRKGGGRNIDNDRYLHINVDDNPQPVAELRRLLDMNLGLLYQEKAGKLMTEGKPREAREAAALAARYTLQLDPQIRRRFDANAAAPNGRLRAILQDKEFLKELFPEN
jgi:uncharacterized Ntn-hydrolase superfamily protein